MPKENLVKIIAELKDLQEKILKTENVSAGRVFWRKAKSLEKKVFASISDGNEKDFFHKKMVELALPVGFLGGFLGENQLYQLFQCCLKDILGLSEETLLDRLKNCLLAMPVFVRDDIKTKLKNILENSDTLLTTPKLLLEGKIVLPTIGNWLKDYHFYLRGKSGNLEKVKYFIASDNIKKIKDEERKLVKKLVKIYDYLDSSSLEPDGHEEDYIISNSNRGEQGQDDELKIFSQGKLTPVDSRNKYFAKMFANLEKNNSTNNKIVSSDKNQQDNSQKYYQEISNLEKLLKNYSPQSLEYQAIQEEIAKLKKKYVK